MSVFKRYQGKRITSKHPKYAAARWWCYRRVKGHKTIHQAIPEARTREQAERAEHALVEALYNRRYNIADTSTTFGQFCDRVYNSYVRQKNENVYVKMIFVETLRQHFEHRVLSTITAQDCRDFQAKRLRTPTKTGTRRAAASVNKETSTLSKIFTLAIQEGIITDTPMRFVAKLKEAEPRRRQLTDKQKAALAAALNQDPELFDAVTLGLTLPLRRGQIFAIKAEDVDRDHGILRVVQSKGKPPRNVPLNDPALVVLNRRAAYVGTGKLFNFTPTTFQKRWTKALVASGINKDGGTRNENFHFHDLRHVLGSELMAANTNPYYIQELFNHSDMKTSAIYITPEMRKLKDAVSVLKGLPLTDSDTIN